jgi:murein L,D-transpeptidase YafK
MLMLRKLAALLAVFSLALALAACNDFGVDGKATAPLSGDLLTKIKAIGSTPGAPMMMRIFKQDSVLEVWKQTGNGQYALLTTYNICSWSGGLGPKITEGDRQAPEGFYDITPGLLNPHSNYYLAFNTGFPNKFDRSYGRTGGDLMVHGDCSSSGCYAMTDAEIAELYSLVRESLAGGNKSVQLEIFPFRMTADNLAHEAGNPNLPFWENIKTGYDDFEAAKRPPRWDVCDRKYVFNQASADGQPLDATAPCPALKTAYLGAPVGAATVPVASSG